MLALFGICQFPRFLATQDLTASTTNFCQSTREGDLGFQGLQNDYANIHLPHKKPKGKELSAQQKEENQEFSSQRVKCEHAHAGIKRYNSVTDVYRNRVPDFDDLLMLIAAGLWNFYLDVA